MQHLLSQRVSLVSYIAYLRGLWPLYGAMERALARAEHPVCAVFRRPELLRGQRIQADILSLTARDTLNESTLMTSGADHRPTLEALRIDTPMRLAAMAYVRYNGDLAGGQMLARHFAKRLDTTESEGGQFYCFTSPTFATSEALLDKIRHDLGYALEKTGTLPAFTDCARDAFAWHGELFDTICENLELLHGDDILVKRGLATVTANP